MSRIKGGRASAMDVAAFTKKTKGKGKAPAKKAPPPMARRPMPAGPMDMTGADEGPMDSAPEQDMDVMPPPRKGLY